MWDATCSQPTYDGAWRGIFKRYLTPPDTPTGFTCRRIRVPDDPQIKAALAELISRLSFCDHWDDSGGGITTEAAAALGSAIFDSYVESEIDCMIGVILPVATSTLPANMLWCDGATYNRVDYPDLYAALHASFKPDADHFITPNLTHKFIQGVDSLTPAETGSTGGSATVTLTEAEMPTHTHIQNAHTHTQNSHNHTQDAHTHTQNAHTHVQNAHTHLVNDPAHTHLQNTHDHTIADGGHTHLQNAHNHGITDPTHNHTQNSHGHNITDPTHNHSQNSHNHTLSDVGHSHDVPARQNATAFSTGGRLARVTGGTDAYLATDTATTGITIAAGTATNVAAATGISVQSQTAVNQAAATGISVNNATPTNQSAVTGITINPKTPTNQTAVTGITVANETAVNQNATATNQNTTATNNATTAVNQNATAVNQNTGGGGAHNNLPPFMLLPYAIVAL